MQRSLGSAFAIKKPARRSCRFIKRRGPNYLASASALGLCRAGFASLVATFPAKGQEPALAVLAMEHSALVCSVALALLQQDPSLSLQADLLSLACTATAKAANVIESKSFFMREMYTSGFAFVQALLANSLKLSSRGVNIFPLSYS
jgi:hypothetical protein